MPRDDDRRKINWEKEINWDKSGRGWTFRKISIWGGERRVLWKKQEGEANQRFNSIEGERLSRKNDQLGWSYCKSQVLLWPGEYVWPFMNSSPGREQNKGNVRVMDKENLELQTDNTYHKYILFFSITRPIKETPSDYKAIYLLHLWTISTSKIRPKFPIHSFIHSCIHLLKQTL